MTYTKVGRPQGLGAGNDSVGIVVHLGTRSGEIRVVLLSSESAASTASSPFSEHPTEDRRHPGEADRAGGRPAHQGRARPANAVAPAITGTVQVGQSLAAQNGTWLSSPVTYTYQWERCDASRRELCADRGRGDPVVRDHVERRRLDARRDRQGDQRLRVGLRDLGSDRLVPPKPRRRPRLRLDDAPRALVRGIGKIRLLGGVAQLVRASDS